MTFRPMVWELWSIKQFCHHKFNKIQNQLFKGNWLWLKSPKGVGLSENSFLTTFETERCQRDIEFRDFLALEN
jgi:hypothetical protein